MFPGYYPLLLKSNISAFKLSILYNNCILYYKVFHFKKKSCVAAKSKTALKPAFGVHSHIFNPQKRTQMFDTQNKITSGVFMRMHI